MDLVDHAQSVFEGIVEEYRAFLQQVDIRPAGFIPVCGRDGDNVARRAVRMPWYAGPTVLDILDAFETEAPPTDKPFRMPVQDVYKFTQQGDDRRIVAGTIETGRVTVGDEVVFYPSGKKSRVRSIEAFNRPPLTEAAAGGAAGFTLWEQIYVARGEIATRAAEPRPKVTTRLRVSLFWLGKSPLVRKRDYILKLGTVRVLARLEEIHRVVDASSLETSEQKARIDRHDVAECVLKLNRAIAFDLADEIAGTSRFVLVDDFEIRGGGVVREALPDRQEWVRDKVMLRNYKWEPSMISLERRAERYSQKSTLVLVTGAREADRKTLAKDLEARLFDEGKLVYFLGIGSVLYGVDADIERKQENRREHLRRLSEIANILMDAGVILIVVAAELTQEDLELIKATVDPDRIETVWAGDHVTTDIEYDLHLGEEELRDDAVIRVKGLLRDKGIIFQPW
ncbi:MAG: elongation factor 1-alpha C-terminal domain-related protein, partial [Candidatus Rokuibacteriota bacterium]